MIPGAGKLIILFLRWFFRLLYHNFAWTYDLVATAVSVGLWFDWIETSLPYLDGSPVLELGFGTGHLQEMLFRQGIPIFGLDESPQMASIARRRLSRQGSHFRLVRALAQQLPYPTVKFERVVATFPSEFAIAPETLSEVHRVLTDGGKFIILPYAWITAKSLPHRLARALFRVTQEAPSRETFSTGFSSEFEKRLVAAGFEASTEFIPTRQSEVMIIVSAKPPHSL